VKLLLETGKVDVDLKDKYGWTPLSWAAREGHNAVVKLLKGVDVLLVLEVICCYCIKS
jgi:Ankyrin repeats (3 copies)